MRAFVPPDLRLPLHVVIFLPARRSMRSLLPLVRGSTCDLGRRSFPLFSRRIVLLLDVEVTFPIHRDFEGATVPEQANVERPTLTLPMHPASVGAVTVNDCSGLYSYARFDSGVDRQLNDRPRRIQDEGGCVLALTICRSPFQQNLQRRYPGSP